MLGGRKAEGKNSTGRNEGRKERSRGRKGGGREYTDVPGKMKEEADLERRLRKGKEGRREAEGTADR